MSAAGLIWRRGADPGDRRSGASVLPKIDCGCCARCGSRPCSSFEIEPATWAAVVASAATINEISAERIREELVRIFLSPNRVRGWDLLDASGLMRAILPELEAMKGCEQPPQFHPEGDVFKHTRIMLELLPKEVSLPLVLQRPLSRHRQAAHLASWMKKAASVSTATTGSARR